MAKSSAKTASKSASAKKRGAYSFGEASLASTAKNQARKNTASAKRVANKAASSARSNINLGFASISKSASNASRQTASTVNESVNRSAGFAKDAFANAANNAKQVQNKITSLSKEVTQNLTDTANRAAQNANTTLELSRQNAEVFAQSLQTASDAVKRTTAQFFSFANTAFADNVEAARQALECRNVSELFELQSRTLRSNIESAMEEAMRISEIAIQTAAEALEPINESVSKSSRKLSELVNA